MVKLISAEKETFFRKSMSVFTAVVFISGMVFVPVMPAQAQYVSTLPEPGAMVESSPAFEPAVLRGLTINPDNPLQFDFLVDRGEVKSSKGDFEKETQKLIKYFLAAMTIPDKEAWVNLSPYEGDRIIPDMLALTDMGRDMLEQDYLLKQISASMTNPEKELGKKFWDTVYKRAFELYGTTEVPINTFNKVWILPEKAVILEQDGYAFIGYSRLKVMMDEDYTSLKENAKSKKFGTESMDQDKVAKLSALSSKIVKEIIIPELEKEVNEGQHFVAVRQIYNSVILAIWYKKNLKETLLGKVYADQGKISGVDIPEKDVKQKVYAQYLEAFRRGVYNVIQEDYDAVTQDVLPRKYFSGGVVFGAAASSALQEIRIDTGENGKNQVTVLANDIKKFASDPVRIGAAGDQLAKFLVADGVLPNIAERTAKKIVDDIVAQALALKEGNGVEEENGVAKVKVDLTEPSEGQLKKGQLALVHDETRKSTAAANDSTLQAGAQIEALLTSLVATKRYPALLNDLLNTSSQRREALTNLLLAISLTPRGEYILDGEVLLPREYFTTGTELILGDLNLKVLATLRDILIQQEEGKIAPIAAEYIAALQEVALERKAGQERFEPLLRADKVTRSFEDGTVTIAYEADSKSSYIVFQSADLSTRTMQNVSGDIANNSFILGAFKSSADFKQWLADNSAASKDLSSQQKQLFLASLAQSLRSVADYTNYENNIDIHNILGVIAFLGGAQVSEDISARMAGATAAERQRMLNAQLAQVLLSNLDEMVNAAAFLGVESESAHFVAKKTVYGTMKGAYAQDTDLTEIIVAKFNEFSSYTFSGDARILIDAFENPYALIDFLSSAQKEKNSGYVVPDGRYVFNAQYVLIFAGLEQRSVGDFETGFNQKTLQVLEAAVNNQASLKGDLEALKSETDSAKKKSDLITFLKKLFSANAQAISEFFAISARQLFNYVHVDQRSDGMVTVERDLRNNATVIGVRITDSLTEQTISRGTFSVKGIPELSFADIDTAYKAGELILAVNRSNFTSEQQGHVLQIVLAANSIPTGHFGYNEMYSRYENPIIDQILNIFEQGDPGLMARYTMPLLQFQLEDMRKEYFLKTLLPGLLAGENMGAVAKVLGVTLNTTSVVKEMGDRTVESVYNAVNNKTTVMVEDLETNLIVPFVVKGDWRNIPFAEKLSGSDFQELMGIVAQRSNLTAAQQGDLFQLLAAAKGLAAEKFRLNTNDRYDPQVEIILEDAERINAQRVAPWVIGAAAQAAATRQKSFYTQLLPDILAGKDGVKLFASTAKTLNVNLQPLALVASSASVSFADGDITIKYNPRTKSTVFLVKPTRLSSAPLASDVKNSGYILSGDLSDMLRALQTIGSIKEFEELMVVTLRSQRDLRMQSLVFKVLLDVYTTSADSVESFYDAKNEYVQKSRKILEKLRSISVDKAALEVQIKEVNAISGLVEQREYFVKTFLPQVFSVQPTEIDAIAQLLGLNIASQTLVSGEKINIQYNVATDTTVISGEYRLASPRLYPFEITLKGDWRSYSFSDFFSAEVLAKAFSTVAKDGDFTSYQQQNFMQIKQVAGRFIPRDFSGEEESKHEPRVHKLLNLVSRLDLTAPKAAQARNDLFMAFKKSDDREIVNRERRKIFLEEFLPNLLKEKPGTFSMVAEILGVKLQARVEESLSAEDIARYQERNLLQIQAAATEISLNEFTGDLLSGRVMTILLEFDLNSPMAEALTKRIAEVQNPAMRQRIFVADYLPTLLRERPEVTQLVAELLGIELDAPVIVDSREAATVASSAASDSQVGGIDFDPSLLDLQIKRNGKGVALPLPQQNIDQIHIDGLYPVILNIQPAAIQDFPFLLSARTPPESAGLPVKN